MSNIYDELSKGEVFGFIDPLIAEIQHYIKGPSTVLSVPASVWSRGDVRKFLKSKGLDAWGFVLIGDDITFSVKKQQAKLIEMLLKDNQPPVKKGWWAW
jgi:hypothetical protein